MRNLRGQISLVVLAIALGIAVLSAEVRTADSGLALDQTQATCTTTVSPDASIQAAIEAASAESVLCLEAGEWTEHVTIGKSLTLRGTLSDSAIIEPRTILKARENGRPMVRIDAAKEIDVVLENLKVTGASGQPEGRGILVEGAAQVTIQDSTVSRNDAEGILLKDTAEATIVGNVSENLQSGILIIDSANATIDSYVGENVTVGVRLRDSAQATIREALVGTNFIGLQLEDSTQATIVDSTIIDSKGSGIFLGDSAQATIRKNVIEGNAGFGILSNSSGDVRGQENEMRENGADLGGNLPGTLRQPLLPATEEEIVYPDQRYPTLQHAVDALHRGGELILEDGVHAAGLTFTKELTLTAQGEAEATLQAKASNAATLSLVGGAEITATGLTVIGGPTRFSSGFRLGSGARAMIRDSTVSENGLGMWFGGSAQATIRGSTISENDLHGILLAGSAQATLERNEILDNGQEGVALSGGQCIGIDAGAEFQGLVSGKQNTIPGRGAPDGNTGGAVCPDELGFLMTETGGALDRRE